MIDFEAILRGEDRAVARAISILENDLPQTTELLQFLETVPKRAHRIGITGPQASGKSTLLGCFGEKWLAEGKKVGVVAIDPSSYKTGGAFLGDRPRMPKNIIMAKNFFFRSMATRGNEHGLVDRLDSLLDVFDAAGKDIIAVETIGASQNEIAIRRYVATLVLVLLPTGDSVTYDKAGLMEAADIFVLNYGDLPTADSSFRQLCESLHTHEKSGEWNTPAFRTVAINNAGVQEVTAALQAHHDFLEKRI